MPQQQDIPFVLCRLLSRLCKPLEKITELDAAWNTQKEAFNRITTRATERYQELDTLINYFEHEMLIVSFASLSGIVANQPKWISDDV